MADTQRTRAAILALFGDNVTGNISPQDARDMIVTIMNTEFVNEGDFWKQPDPQKMTGDRTVRGWVDYSQLIAVACSMGDVLMRNASGAWSTPTLTGDVSDVRNIGMATDDVAAASTVGNVLRKGLIKIAAASIQWSDGIGRPHYLDSGAVFKTSNLSAAVMSVAVIAGWPENEGSDYTVSITDVFRFEPGWGVHEDF